MQQLVLCNHFDFARDCRHFFGLWICHPVFLVRNVSFIWPSLVPRMRGETAIEKHLRLQNQADELAEKIDFNACVHVRRTRDLAVTQAKMLFESRGWWKPALQELMESSKQGRIKNEKDDDEYSESTVDSTLQCKIPRSKGGNLTFRGQGRRRHTQTKKSKLFDATLSDIVLQQELQLQAEYTRGPHSPCLVRVGAGRVQLHEHQASSEGEATGGSQG